MCNIRTTFTHNETMIIDALKSISYFYTQTHFDWKCIRYNLNNTVFKKIQIKKSVIRK